MRGDKGLTLMELLVVISILGLLVTVMLPFQGRMSDNAKREETIQLFESIRFGLLGAENAYDANGNRVLGGYVGDYGTLPKFVVHAWDTTKNEWIIPEDTSIADAPTIMDWEDTTNHNYHDASIMPLNLWTNTIRIDGVTDPQELMPHADWNGPYVVVPRDDFSSDDDLYSYTAPSGSSSHDDESRHFLLRQGEGRLTDGWGSAIHIYFDDKKNLYFVSAGSDRRINFGAETTPPTDFGPADLTLQHNDDNVVLMISHEQWNLTDQKIATTRQQLKDIKSALLGRYGSVTDGVNQPNGFIADMGSFELLTGSYILNGGTVYQCVESHTASGSFSPTSSAWKAVAGGSTSIPVTDFPFAGDWISGREYHAATPQLLAINGDYVKVETPPSSGEYTYYRCVKDNTTTNQSPTSHPDMWIEDNTFKGHAWVPNYASGTMYKKETIPSWEYYTNVKFGVGWRGPYTLYSDTPLTDAWGREIQLELDTVGGLIMRSTGLDIADSTDDIIESIQRSDYAVPATVIVKPSASVTMLATDYVSVYTALNGKVASIAAESHAIVSNDGQFLFTKPTQSETKIFVPTIGVGTDITTGFHNASAYDSAGGTWLPIGRVTVVYQKETAGVYGSPAGYQETFIIHPRTAPTLTLGD